MHIYVEQFTSKHKLSIRRTKNINENQMLNVKHDNNNKNIYLEEFFCYYYLKIIHR